MLSWQLKPGLRQRVEGQLLVVEAYAKATSRSEQPRTG